MSGFGSQPAGSSPYGLGTPATAPSQAGGIFVDPATGLSTGSRLIDPATRDYVYDENGRAVGMSDVQQLVFLAVSTRKGSAAMRELGQELEKIDRITANTARRVDVTMRDAVQHLVSRGLIAVTGTTVEVVGSSRIQMSLLWRDLTGQVDGDQRTDV